MSFLISVYILRETLPNPPNTFLFLPTSLIAVFLLIRLPMQWVLSADGLVSNHIVTRRAGRTSFCSGKLRAGIGFL